MSPEGHAFAYLKKQSVPMIALISRMQYDDIEIDHDYFNKCLAKRDMKSYKKFRGIEQVAQRLQLPEVEFVYI
jgi:hypothetical protein